MVLLTVLEILNDQERAIILLHAVSGLTHREIANDLVLPLSTVLSKYHRGLKKLRKHLTEQEVPK
jgi:RNA polymerase sigma-70 factor (ECF subfamily)